MLVKVYTRVLYKMSLSIITSASSIDLLHIYQRDRKKGNS